MLQSAKRERPGKQANLLARPNKAMPHDRKWNATFRDDVK